MERAGKEISCICPAEKILHFLAKGIAKNVREGAMPGKKSKEG
jgi:hypothetical protein